MEDRDLHPERRRLGRALSGPARLLVAVGALFLLLPPAQAAQDESLARVREAGVLRACADPDNPPLSSARAGSPPGVDVEVVQALAEELGVRLEVVWVDTWAMDRALRRLRTGACDLLAGLPVDQGFLRERPWLDITVPIYATGYLLAIRDSHLTAEARLADLREETIGVEARTIADYQLHRSGFARRLYPSQTLLLEALEAGEVPAAVVLGPVAGWRIRGKLGSGVRLVLHPPLEAPYRWNVAMALRRADGSLKQALDEAIRKLQQDGAIARLMAAYGVVHSPPFE